MSGAIVFSDALILSRAAIVGPYIGPTLHVNEPGFDKPSNLALWADGPRIEACFSDLTEGLLFKTRNGPKEAELGFANLQANNIQRKPLVTLRAPTKGQFKKQLDLVAAYADLRADRAAEVVAQVGLPVAFWSSVIGLSAHRHKKTLQLMELVFLLCVETEMRFKHIFASLRPVAMSPQIQPMIETPGHGSWPSGHATESFAMAVFIEKLLDAASPPDATPSNGTASREQLQRLAARIATNRVVAGVHFPVDSAAGRLLGTALAEFLVARATGGKVHTRGFDARQYQKPDGAALDFSLHQPLTDGDIGYSRAANGYSVGSAPLVGWLWEEALKEWA